MKHVAILFILINCIDIYSGSWAKISAIDPYSKSFNDFKCADSCNCLLITDYRGWGGLLYKSTDGCQTWNPILIDTVITFPAPARYLSLSFPSIDLCYISRDSGYVLRSTDFGSNWEHIEFDKNSIPYIVMYNNKYGFMSVPFYEKTIHFFKFTTDGGISWNDIDVPDKYKSIAIGEISIPEENLVILKATIEDIGSRILKIVNNKDWIELPWPENIHNVDYIDKNVVYAVGGEKISENIYTQLIKKSTDGGLTWFTIRDTNFNNGSLYQVYFIDEFIGLVVGTRFCLLRTNDGGYTWYQDDVDSTLKSIKSISFLSHSIAYMMSQRGEIYKYYPTGTNSICIDLIYNFNILLFPNPLESGNNLYINSLMIQNNRFHIQIINLVGKIVIDEVIIINNSTELVPGCNYLQKGMYILKINNEFQKLIVI